MFIIKSKKKTVVIINRTSSVGMDGFNLLSIAVLHACNPPTLVQWGYKPFTCIRNRVELSGRSRWMFWIWFEKPVVYRMYDGRDVTCCWRFHVVLVLQGKDDAIYRYTRENIVLHPAGGYTNSNTMCWSWTWYFAVGSRNIFRNLFYLWRRLLLVCSYAVNLFFFCSSLHYFICICSRKLCFRNIVQILIILFLNGNFCDFSTYLYGYIIHSALIFRQIANVFTSRLGFLNIFIWITKIEF